MIPKTKEVSCCDCHMKATIDATLHCPPDWDYLSLTGRVRCGSCRRELEAVNSSSPTYPMQRPDFQDTQFMPLQPIDLTPLSDPEPAPAPFRSGGGGDFGGGGAQASFEVASAPSPSPAPAPAADPPAAASDSSGSDSSSSSGD